MLEINKAHDRFFKSSMSDIRVAEDFFKHNLPKEALDSVDLTTLKLSPNSYVDPALQELISDVLYEVEISHEPGYLYILAEHQSKVEHLMPFRILQYIVLIWADHLKKIKCKGKEKLKDERSKSKCWQNGKSQELPLIIPIIFYNGKTKYHGPRDVKALINAPRYLIDRFLFKPFDLIDTHDLKDEVLQKQHWAGITTFVMKHIRDREIYAHIHTIIDMLKKVCEETSQDSAKNSSSQLIRTVLQYIFTKGNTQYKALFLNDIVEGLQEPIGDEVMSIAKQFIEEGIAEGISIGVSKARNEVMSIAKQFIEEGMIKGRAEGIAIGVSQERTQILIDLIQNKFGGISMKYKMLIDTASSEEFKRWLKKILWAKSIEAIFESETVDA